MSNGYVLSGARLKVGSTLITASDIISIELSRDFGTVQTTGLSETEHTHVTTVGDGTLVVNGYWTSGSAAPANSLRAAIESVTAQADRKDTLTLYPDGITSGNQTLAFDALLTNVTGPTAANDAFGALNATFQKTGVVTSGSSTGS